MSISGITNMFSNNNLGFKPNGSKRYLQPTKEIESIENKLSNGMSVDDLSKEEYAKLNAFEKAESAAFYAQVYSEMSQAERIAIKIAKGENLTPEEERLINEKYPDLRKEAEQAKKEGEELKKRMQHAKTSEEKRQLAANAMNNVGSMINKGSISPIQAQIKIAAIEKAIEEADEDGSIINRRFKHENMKKGSFINREV